MELNLKIYNWILLLFYVFIAVYNFIIFGMYKSDKCIYDHIVKGYFLLIKIFINILKIFW